jgi:hypothetical protein
MKMWKNEDGTTWIMFVDDIIDNTLLEDVFKVRHVKTLKLFLAILAVIFYTAMVEIGLYIYLHPESIGFLMYLGVALLLGSSCLRIMYRLKFNKGKNDSEQ